MSDRRLWARRVLADAAAEFAPLAEESPPIGLKLPPGAMAGPMPQRNAEVFRTALHRIAIDSQVEKLVAKFGDTISLTPAFVQTVRRDAAVEAARRMMHATAFAMADPNCKMVAAKDIVAKREEIEKTRAQATTLLPSVLSEDESKLREYISGLDWMLSIQAPLDDPIVERRRPSPLAKRFHGKPPDARAYSHAGGILARVRPQARLIFDRAADRVADAFAGAATGIPFSRKDNRLR